VARTALDSAVDAWQFEWLEEGLLPRVTLFVRRLCRCGEHLVQEFGLMSGMDAVSRRRGVPCSCDCRVTAAGPAGTADRIGVRGLVSGVEFLFNSTRARAGSTGGTGSPMTRKAMTPLSKTWLGLDGLADS
jgi:hypothetical protein